VIDRLAWSPDGRYVAVGLAGANGIRVFETGDWHAGPPPLSSGGRTPAPRPTGQASQNTRQMAQNYNRLNQQVSEINQEQSTIERTATAVRERSL
jgi:hypothetical protein